MKDFFVLSGVEVPGEKKEYDVWIRRSEIEAVYKPIHSDYTAILLNSGRSLYTPLSVDLTVHYAEGRNVGPDHATLDRNEVYAVLNNAGLKGFIIRDVIEALKKGGLVE